MPKQEYDLDKAKKLLDDAGWVPGGDGIRVKDGVRLSFKNSTTAGNHIREQAQQFIQQSYRDIGVEVVISNLPPAVMWGDYWMKSEFDSVVVGINFLTGSIDTSDYLSSKSIPAKGGRARTPGSMPAPAVDKLLESGGVEFVPEQRKQAYLKIQETVRSDLPFLPMFQYATVRGHKSGVEGVVPNINVRINSWDVATWYWA